MDFHQAMETFAEAWVAANTHTAVSASESSQHNHRSVEDLPTSFSLKDHPQDTKMASTHQEVSGQSSHKLPGSLSSPQPTTAKTLPIHCIVEQTVIENPSKEPQVELDTYAIVPGTTLFTEVVRTALLKVGYTASEALGAKGAIQIKKWKPLNFENITENPEATVEELLGDLTSHATLRIRLCSHPKLYAMEDIKEKLLNFLLRHSHSVLQSAGCPIEKNLLTQITQGTCSQAMPEHTRNAFNKWYAEKVKTTEQGEGHSEGHPSPASQSQSDNEGDSISPPPVGCSTPIPPVNNRFTPDHQVTSKTRIRTAFDQENEIPRLQKWFSIESHPSKDQMLDYLNELNSLEFRKERKPLELTNIVYWFKNARAAQRRAAKGLDTLSDQSSGENGELDLSMDRLSPTDVVPELPNKNAVYVVNPMLHRSRTEETRNGHVEYLGTMSDEDRSHSPSIKSPFTRPPMKLPATPAKLDLSMNSSLNTPVRGGDLKSDNDIRSMHNFMKSREAITRSDVKMEVDEQATDLRMHSRRNSSESIATQASSNYSDKAVENLVVKVEREREREGRESVSTTSSTPSPRMNNSSSPSSLPGGFNPVNPLHPHPPSHPYSHMHQQLQMAAMSHALNLHYMHPASGLYPPLVTSPYSQSPSPKDPNQNTASSLSEERRKRSRVFIDPLTEIPKLEKWFEEDTHPSSYMIEKYTEEMNRAPYRQRFPKLEAKNVQLWFKNHRAKVKRARLEQAAIAGSHMHRPDTAIHGST